MPLRNEQGSAVLVFFGEEFPEPSPRRKLKEKGHAVEEHGPSYLVHWYEEDATFYKHLNGRFHGLAADKNRGAATLFNDRYGVHRIYYHEGQEAFYFAAEAKAILAVRPELRVIDQQGLGEFVSCGCTMNGRTLFAGIQLMPGGSVWSVSPDGKVKKERYFTPGDWEGQTRLSGEEFYQELRNVYTRNLPRYFRRE